MDNGLRLEWRDASELAENPANWRRLLGLVSAMWYNNGNSTNGGLGWLTRIRRNGNGIENYIRRNYGITGDITEKQIGKNLPSGLGYIGPNILSGPRLLARNIGKTIELNSSSFIGILKLLPFSLTVGVVRVVVRQSFVSLLLTISIMTATAIENKSRVRDIKSMSGSKRKVIPKDSFRFFAGIVIVLRHIVKKSMSEFIQMPLQLAAIDLPCSFERWQQFTGQKGVRLAP